MSIETVYLLAPEMVLTAVAVVIYVGGALVGQGRGWNWLALAGLAIAAALLASGGHEAGGGASVAVDALAYYGRWLALGVGALLAILAWRPLAGRSATEYAGSLLLTVVGLMLVAGAGELVLLFVGLELISIPTYVLLYLGRPDAASQEATAKYFFLSIFASALLLYGLSFLYGATGSTEIAEICARLSAAPGSMATVALVLIFAGLGFKIAAAPFQFYAPDVYQGTTHPNAALLSVVPKAAGFIGLVRLLIVAMPALEPYQGYAWRIAMVLAVLTMTYGNVIALWQDNLRRLLAYSSIAHAGYMLTGLSVGLAAPAASGWDGIGSLLFYLCVYAVATIGAFAVLACLGRTDREVCGVDELAGLGQTQPVLAAAMGVFMLSLAGIPPLAGFWGKLAIFGSALGVDAGNPAWSGLRLWFIGLAVVGVLNAAVAAAYYLRIVGVMYFRLPLSTPKAQGGLGAWTAAMACAVLTVGIGLHSGPLLGASNYASPGVDRDTSEAPADQGAQKKAAISGLPQARSGGRPVTPLCLLKRLGVILEAPVTTNCHPYLKSIGEFQEIFSPGGIGDGPTANWGEGAGPITPNG